MSDMDYRSIIDLIGVGIVVLVVWAYFKRKESPKKRRDDDDDDNDRGGGGGGGRKVPLPVKMGAAAVAGYAIGKKMAQV